MSRLHQCQICFIGMEQHPAPVWAANSTGYLGAPCCKGCGCGSYEIALAEATDEERVVAAEYEVMSLAPAQVGV